jgi:hypothetical protein
MKYPRKNAKERKDSIYLIQITHITSLCVLLCFFADFILLARD